MNKLDLRAVDCALAICEQYGITKVGADANIARMLAKEFREIAQRAWERGNGYNNGMSFMEEALN